ncbi:MAG: GGDEF and EAL domain-containing protein [Acidobacteria bacterium]|nr:GGDEF and EAL domain-containing protein [Acidobacteriota bacterium]
MPDTPSSATWEWMVTSDRVAYSAAWHALLGDGKGDTTESLHAWLGRVHPDDVASVMHALDRHLSGGAAAFRCEHRLRSHAGAFRWVVAEGVAVRDTNGRAVRLAGTLADVQERNRTDTLAGLPGLFALRAHVDRLVAAARETPSSRFALLLVDLDRFGEMNAMLGHDGGDVLLREALRRLARCLREGDLVARIGVHDTQARAGDVALPPLGGDECALVISNLIDVRDAQRVAARLHDALAAPFPIAGHRLFASACVGIAMNSAGHDSVDDLLRDAYSALVRAKTRGPAETQIFDDSARAAPSEFMEFASDLETAMRDGQFEMWFQPTVHLGDGSIVRAEALLRWRHPVRGLLRPNIFVPLLEQAGRLVPFGWQTITDACRSLAHWRTVHAPAQAMRISVNLSSSQVLAPDLVGRLITAVRDAGVEPGDLELEIAELDAMANFDRVVQISQALRDAEFKVALDDFGLGLAATEHIRALGVHTIKIDRSYLGGNPQHGGSAAIVQYAIELAAILGIDVVAEGIETPSELQALKTLRCPLGQGFLFSRAVAADDLLRLLELDAAAGTDWWAGTAPGSTRRRRGSDTAVPVS